MKSWSRLHRKIPLAFGSAILVLFVVGAISYRGMLVSTESERWVRHTHEVLDNLEELRFAMVDAQSSWRGLALTGKDSYLASYRAARAAAVQHEADVRVLTVDNPAQQRRLAELHALLGEALQPPATVMALLRTRSPAPAALALRTGPGLMDELQAAVGRLHDEEVRLLAVREAAAKHRLGQAKVVLVLGTVLGLLIAAGAGWSLQRDASRRGLAADALRDSEERYVTLRDGVQDYAISMLDPQGKVLSWNAGAERLGGYTAAQIVGHSSSCFFPPEDIARGRLEELLQITAASGRHEEQAMRVRKDGKRYLAHVTLTALRDPSGSLRGFSEISRDLTETKESVAKYRGLLEAAPDAMVVVNQAGAIVLLNVQAEKQFGYLRDELVGQMVQEIIPQGFAERLIADGTRSAAEALAQQIGTGIELSGRRKDGSLFPIEIMLSPLESVEGILVTAAIRDISVRKAAEGHLAQMEGRYRGLLEAAPDAIVVVDQAGAIVLLNAQAEKRFGYLRDELVGQMVQEIIPQGFAERLIADGTRSAAEALAQQIGTGIELSGRRKDGSLFPIEIMLSPLESVEGILVTAAIRDISVRKAAEGHLAQMEGRYRGLLEAAPDAIVVVDQAGAIVLLNAQAEKRFGYRRDELVGQQVTNIIPDGFAARLIADALRSTEDALAQQIGTGIELIGHRKNGDAFPIEIMLSPLASAEGILVTVAIREITARKRAEAQLLGKMDELNRSNEELGQFAYIASHDLQEPLRMVASYTQLLSRRYKGKLDADADEFIAFAVDGATRMQRLIQDLLAYSRVGTKGRDLVETSSEDACQQALFNLRGAIDDSGALVTSDPLPIVLADDMQLIQLFQNLVGNGIKYQGPGVPQVHVSAAKTREGRWLFSVRDNGLGIDPQYFEKIFGMFQRLHKREEFGGTGIGLAICKKIVTRHGGSISVESAPGKGSTFSFALTGGENTHDTIGG
jgi:PAS domain S-box-containing protein